jgi:hypothetical protein
MIKQISLNIATKLAICFAIPSSAVFLYLLWKQNKDTGGLYFLNYISHTIQT